MKKPAFHFGNPFSGSAYTTGSWQRLSLGGLVKLDEFIVFENQQRKPGEPEPDELPEVEAVFPRVGVILDLLWISLHGWFTLPVGIWVKQTAEEKGLAALKEFAKKGFDDPFPARTGSTSLHPPIPPEDPTHPQYKAPVNGPE
jgi:hypothetical protein